MVVAEVEEGAESLGDGVDVVFVDEVFEVEEEVEGDLGHFGGLFGWFGLGEPGFAVFGDSDES